MGKRDFDRLCAFYNRIVFDGRSRATAANETLDNRGDFEGDEILAALNSVPDEDDEEIEAGFRGM